MRVRYETPIVKVVLSSSPFLSFCSLNSRGCSGRPGPATRCAARAVRSELGSGAWEEEELEVSHWECHRADDVVVGMKGHRTQSRSKAGQLTADGLWRLRILLHEVVSLAFL